MRRPSPASIKSVLALAALLTGCAGARLRPSRWAGAGSLPRRASASAPWNFDTGEAEGTIAPEGGCPGNFYTSRKWTFEQGSLVIRDHNGQPLGQLALAAPGRFDEGDERAAGAADMLIQVDAASS